MELLPSSTGAAALSACHHVPVAMPQGRQWDLVAHPQKHMNHARRCSPSHNLAHSSCKEICGMGKGPADDFARRNVEETKPLVAFLWCVIAASTDTKRLELIRTGREQARPGTKKRAEKWLVHRSDAGLPSCSLFLSPSKRGLDWQMQGGAT